MYGDISSVLGSHGFKIKKQIGKGGFATVFSVSWMRYPDREFAAKVMSVKDEHDTKKLESFSSEITLLKSLYHKNIIQIFEYFHEDDYLILIMEFCPNGSLWDDVKRNGAIDESKFKHMARQCLEAIKTCHESGIAHRDIKPMNILLDENNRIKLCDFGIAEFTQNRIASRYDGSMAFLPPEVINKQPYNAMKADIWSLGITFYILVSGNIPWEFNGPIELKNKICSDTIIYPTSISTQLVELLAQMLSKNADERPTAASLLKDCYFKEPEELLVAKRRLTTTSNFGNIQLRSVMRFSLPIMKRGHTYNAIPTFSIVKEDV